MADAVLDQLHGHCCARCGLFIGSEFDGPSYHKECKELSTAELDQLINQAKEAP